MGAAVPGGSVAGAPGGGAGDAGGMELPPGVEFVEAERPPVMKGFMRDLPLLAVAMVGTAIGFYWMQRFAQLMNDGGERGAWFGVGAGFTISTLLVFVPPVLSFSRLIRERNARLAAATEVSGEVVAIEAKGVPGEEGYLETPVVRFTTVEGRMLQVRPTFRQLTPKGLEQGDTVSIRYDPAEPGWLVIGELDYGDVRQLKWGLGAAGALMVLVPLGICVYKGLTVPGIATVAPTAVEPNAAPRDDDVSTREALAAVLMVGGFAAALWWEGRRKYTAWMQRIERSHEVTATIVDVNLNVGGTIRNAQPVYHFKGLDGKERTAASAHRHICWRPAKRFTVGTSVRVRYDRDEPQWVVGSEVTAKDVQRRYFGWAWGVALLALLSAVVFIFA